MNRYSVLVTSSPYDNQGPSTALAYCHAILERGDKLDQVFFYQQGIYNAISTMNPPSDETNLFEQWRQLSTLTDVELNVCITAADKRGVKAHSQDACFASPFLQSGLGEFFAKLHNSDRLVQF